MIRSSKIVKETSSMWGIYFSMFLTTMSIFIYETLLTRLFSVILSYNLVFIVVSFAILGGGLAYKILNKKRCTEKVLVVCAVLLPISFFASISIMYFFPFIPTFIAYIPAALLPFVLGGIITSIMFQKKSDYSS